MRVFSKKVDGFGKFIISDVLYQIYLLLGFGGLGTWGFGVSVLRPDFHRFMRLIKYAARIQIWSQIEIKLSWDDSS